MPRAARNWRRSGPLKWTARWRRGNIQPSITHSRRRLRHQPRKASLPPPPRRRLMPRAARNWRRSGPRRRTARWRRGRVTEPKNTHRTRRAALPVRRLRLRRLLLRPIRRQIKRKPTFPTFPSSHKAALTRLCPPIWIMWWKAVPAAVPGIASIKAAG